MQDYIEVTYLSGPKEQEVLIALLSAYGYEGFEQGDDSLKAYIKNDEFDEAVVAEIAEKFKIAYSYNPVKNENWNAIWESSFKPVFIDNFVVIRADFHEPVKGFEHELIITPKMSFGTGHHATTELMIREIQTLDLKNKTVLDFGTGTGILAILAEKCGAAKVTAIDYDELSIANAAENIQMNNAKNIQLTRNDHVQPNDFYDIILANINKHVILDNLETLSGILNKGGFLLLSGILETDETAIQNRCSDYSLKRRKKTAQDRWICLSYVH